MSMHSLLPSAPRVRTAPGVWVEQGGVVVRAGRERQRAQHGAPGGRVQNRRERAHKALQQVDAGRCHGLVRLRHVRDQRVEHLRKDAMPNLLACRFDSKTLGREFASM